VTNFHPTWTLLQQTTMTKKKKEKGKKLQNVSKDLTILHWNSHAFQINV